MTQEADTDIQTSSIVKTHYGMGQAVGVPAPAVSSTILRGFVSSCHNQPQMILSSSFVGMNYILTMKTQ